MKELVKYLYDGDKFSLPNNPAVFQMMEDDARMHVRRTLVRNTETLALGYIKTNMEVIVVT
jgi:hypothetical protein